MNHIDKVNPWQATLMTLQLENMQNVKLADMDHQMYTEQFQQALSQVHEQLGYEQKLTYSRLLKEIKDPTVKKLLQEASDLGFKLETRKACITPSSIMRYTKSSSLSFRLILLLTLTLWLPSPIR
ncbi:hypothetical protein [Paenibacillus sp. Z3-2]